MALAILECDSNLTEMRFQLVPKVTKEVDFWKNYFYRISLIKQSAEPLEEEEKTEEIEVEEEDKAERIGFKFKYFFTNREL